MNTFGLHLPAINIPLPSHPTVRSFVPFESSPCRRARQVTGRIQHGVRRPVSIATEIDGRENLCNESTMKGLLWHSKTGDIDSIGVAIALCSSYALLQKLH